MSRNVFQAYVFELQRKNAKSCTWPSRKETALSSTLLWRCQKCTHRLVLQPASLVQSDMCYSDWKGGKQGWKGEQRGCGRKSEPWGSCLLHPDSGWVANAVWKQIIRWKGRWGSLTVIINSLPVITLHISARLVPRAPLITLLRWALTSGLPELPAQDFQFLVTAAGRCWAPECTVSTQTHLDPPQSSGSAADHTTLLAWVLSAGIWQCKGDPRGTLLLKNLKSNVLHGCPKEMQIPAQL